MSEPFIVAAPPARVTLPAVLEPFAAELADVAVTDLFVNGDHGLFVDRGHGADPVAHWRASEREVRELAAALIGAGGRHIDDAHPCVDVRLPGGYRVHAVLAPVAASGTAISIRVPRAELTGLDALAHAGAFAPGILEVLRAAVARRANFLISGAAGVGKTTLLSALLSGAPDEERIVTIEDVAEIELDHPHHVALESRQANLEGAGAVTLATLVREALRMKPDRLVIGECRGAEVRELLTALNTGHDGGAGTVHANSLTDVAARLEALGALAGMTETALARQVVSALEFVVHLEKDRFGRRHVAAIGTFSVVDGRLAVEPVGAVGAGEAGEASEGAGAGESAERVEHIERTMPADVPTIPATAAFDDTAPFPDAATFDDLLTGKRRGEQVPTAPDAGALDVPRRPTLDPRDSFDALVRGLAADDPAPGASSIEVETPPARAAHHDRFTPLPPRRQHDDGRGHAAA